MTGSDAIAWLLEEDNPSVRLLTLRTLLDQPAGDGDLLSTQAQIPAWGAARTILDAQWPAGYWMRPEGGYSPRHRATMWQVIFLAALGAPLTESISGACTHILKWNRLPDGRFCAHATAASAFPCLNGSLFRALLQLGYPDTCFLEGLEATAQTAAFDGFRCNQRIACPSAGERNGLPCAWGAVKVLGALAEVPAAKRTSAMSAAVEAGTRLLTEECLIEGHWATAARADPRWLRFGFPLAQESDLLEALEILARLGARPGPGVDRALRFVHRKQDPSGRWLLEHSPANTWAHFDNLDHPNKWVTCRALRVLRLWQERGAATGLSLEASMPGAQGQHLGDHREACP